MRIGHKMEMAVHYVKTFPGCTKMDVACYTGPYGSTKYGYEIVNRCIDAGLIQAKQSEKRKGEYELYVK